MRRSRTHHRHHKRNTAALVTVLGLALIAPAAASAQAAPVGQGGARGARTAQAAQTAQEARRAADRTPPDAAALKAAIAGLPDADSTAALVRVGGGDGSWHGAAGERDRRTHAAAVGDERFRVGSVTKTFTAAVVLQLVHEGRLSLDGTVQRYLPGLLPASYPDITVAQLLNYTSGLPSPALPSDFGWLKAHRFTTWGHRQLVELAVRQDMKFKPGTAQDYSNLDYNVLGLLIEKVTHSSYERQVRERIIEPLGLSGTYSPGNDPKIHGRHTHGYQTVTVKPTKPTKPTNTGKPDKVGRTRLMDVTDWNQSITWASGDLISTAGDLERFMTALFSGEVVPQQELKLMFSVPPVKQYGAKDKDAVHSSGLTLSKLPDGTKVWGKSGARYGYNAGIAATSDLRRTLVYSVNSTDAKGDAVNPAVGKITAAAFAGIGGVGGGAGATS
ncbi:serine hydrolase domain-containing protein [Streptomyces varsoviensis]|uniref:serine hydrolase domain-containing protein n=1 Tax=Streptomyces varsoviensis TaxID=67373 RepID=UPI00068D3EF3|nr:serine hydrolase domain-containing protein [Streptomyces varsoviensis]